MTAEAERSLRRSPLDAVHVASGAAMMAFAGWSMPRSYPGGSLAEHRSCRNGAAVFDVSHLGALRVEGPGAFDLLQRAFTNDLGRVGPGRAQYTHMLDDDGSVLDDLVVWWLGAEVFEVVPNAANTRSVQAGLSAGAGGEVAVTDITASRALIAVQGPTAGACLVSVAADAVVDRGRVGTFEWEGETCRSAGTGYTGEDGVECSVPAGVAPAFWGALVAAGAVPAGLGARDTLRLEAGFPLHGHDLGPGITPLQAGLGWVVAWDKGDFRGRAALDRERQSGVGRRRRGIELCGRRPARAGQRVWHQGELVGAVTSGSFSPVLERGIALALLTPTLVVGESVEVEQRGRREPGRLVDLPFVGQAGA